MERCLSETRIEGLPTNISFLKQILADPRYRSNDVSTKFLPKLMEELGL
jgi:pyruvate carboxylase